MNIISELKADHTAMLGALERIREAGVTSARSQEELRQDKEERMLYPEFEKLA